MILLENEYLRFNDLEDSEKVLNSWPLAQLVPAMSK